jgi:hypothetical protein
MHSDILLLANIPQVNVRVACSHNRGSFPINKTELEYVLEHE